MLRREFMKNIVGGLTAIVVPTSIAVGHPEEEPVLSSTWVYRRVSDPHGNRSYWHPVLKAGGYYGKSPRIGRDVGRGWVKFCDGMITPEEWCDFIRKYWAVRQVIEGSEVVKDDELEEMDIHELFHTLYKVSRYLRYHGIGDELIQSAVRNRNP